jgi:hypothetical protein
MWAYTAEEMDFFTKGAHVLCNTQTKNKPPKKETKMTDLNLLNMIEEYRKNARLALNLVPHKDLKVLLEKAVDLQVDAAKLSYDLAKDGYKTLVPAGK